MTTDGLLYSFRRCPFAIRARMALSEAGCDPEIREIILRDKPTHMLEIGVRGTVPLLALPDGRVFEDSEDIMRWSLARHDPREWARHVGAPRYESLMVKDDGPFKRALDRYKYPDRFPPSEAEGARERGLGFLERLDSLLRDENRPYVDGDNPGFFDAGIFPFVRQFAAVDPGWFETHVAESVVRWRARMLDHHVFTRVMNKIPVWKPGDPARTLRESLAPPS